MEFDLWYLVALPALFAAGWLCRGFDRRQRSEKTQLPEHFTRGVALLLDDEPDKAIDVLVEACRLDPDLIELHHMLGKLFRRRGEFERAIRLHLHLVNRSDLSDADRTKALSELAEDYFAAGLFDRAEAEYRKLSEVPSEHLGALRRLLTIYTIEHEWESAIDTMRAVEAQTGEDHRLETAHFYCERIEVALRAKRLEEAAKLVAEVLPYADVTPRVDHLAGKVALAAGSVEEAAEHWRRLARNFPAHTPLVIGELADAMAALGQKEEALELLRSALPEHPTADALEAVIARVTEWRGLREAEAIAAKMLSAHPSLSAFNALVRLRAKANPEDEQTKLLSGLLQRHAQRFARYQCTHCGFLASNFAWHCLGCGSWDSFPPRRVEDAKGKSR